MSMTIDVFYSHSVSCVPTALWRPPRRARVLPLVRSLERLRWAVLAGEGAHASRACGARAYQQMRSIALRLLRVALGLGRGQAAERAAQRAAAKRVPEAAAEGVVAHAAEERARLGLEREEEHREQALARQGGRRAGRAVVCCGGRACAG